MKKDIDVTKAKDEFEWLFMRRVLGSYAIKGETKKEIIADVKARMRIMTVAYQKLTKVIENNELDFLKQ